MKAETTQTKTETVYDALHAGFRWHVPADFNIAEACCGRWARDTPDAPAILHETGDGAGTPLTFAALQAMGEVV